MKASSSYNRALHVFGVFTACAAFLLIVAGALVTSNGAGLSVPDWPTSFGRSPVSHAYFTVPMTGGVMYEHGHRIFAEFLGVLTIVLAFWTWRTDRRAWMRKLGLAALGTIILQGLVGGLTVLLKLPAVVSTVHATLGQTFFCLAVAIALFTGRRWVGEEEQKDRQIKFDAQHPALPTLAWLSVAAIYGQLILGSMFRHHGMGLLPHLIGAVVVTALLLWTLLRTLLYYGETQQLSHSARRLFGLLLTQLALGLSAYATRLVFSHDAGRAIPITVAATVAHVSVGALLLATAVVLAIQATRHVPVLHEASISGTRKPIAV